jgi:PAS domain S-box-containing protein
VSEWASTEKSRELTLYRRLLLIASGTYMVWWFAVELLLPTAFNPFGSRFAVVATIFAAWVASFIFLIVQKHLVVIFQACAWLITLHYYYLFLHNDGDFNWVVGCYITVMAIGFCFFTAKQLLSYSLFVLALSIASIILVPHLLNSVFLPGLLTILIQANLGLRSRLALIKTLRDSNRRFQLLFNSTFEGVMVHEKGLITDVNESLLQKTGYSRGELLGQDPMIIVPPAQRPLVTRNMEMADIEPFETRVQRKDGAVIDVETRAKDFEYDSHMARLVTIQDISDRKKAETERISALTLAENVRIRDDFISIASHELKTPISSLKLQALLVERELAKEPSETYPTNKLREVLGLFHRQADRLTELVETMLDVSRISAGRLSLVMEPVDLRVLVGDVVSLLNTQRPRNSLPITIDAPAAAPMQGDRVRIKQVIENLVVNAIKYGEEKPIAVQVRTEGSRAVVVVKDQGPGIPHEAVDRIFNRFERAVSSRHISGLGLGLYIAKQVVEAHGGAISVESQPGFGSTFTARFPTQLSEKS